MFHHDVNDYDLPGPEENKEVMERAYAAFEGSSSLTKENFKDEEIALAYKYLIKYSQVMVPRTFKYLVTEG